MKLTVRDKNYCANLRMCGFYSEFNNVTHAELAMV
ncbi:hypothetical protein PAECIP111891_01470 [Paenibacillus allorhizoplanae]|uniref:Uncharacterized protein n=1 Tax=Paenibacillus allorhizoplanae TaxID=2905648 RepID=A0ABN8G4W7_9BACL|nr:hypothetical protein PAECIP111891_01470 [Paenibacillus allorhizoplanae]